MYSLGKGKAQEDTTYRSTLHCVKTTTSKDPENTETTANANDAMGQQKGIIIFPLTVQLSYSTHKHVVTWLSLLSFF